MTADTPETVPEDDALAGPCDCEFDPYDDDDEESWHFRRTCARCGNVWWALHCPHDGIQNPCPACRFIEPGKRTPLQALGLSHDPEERHRDGT